MKDICVAHNADSNTSCGCSYSLRFTRNLGLQEDKVTISGRSITGMKTGEYSRDISLFKLKCRQFGKHSKPF